MQSQLDPYFISMFASAILAGSASIFFWRRRDLPGVKPFVFVAAAVAIWCIANAAETAAPGLQVKLLWIDLHYVSLVTIPVAWLLTVLEFGGFRSMVSRRRLLTLCVIPAITLVLTFTSALHGLMRYDVYLDTSGPIAFVAKRNGPWFWVHATYSYLLLLTSAALLVRTIVRGSTRLHRTQAAALLLAMAIPWSTDILFLAYPRLISRLDPSPLLVGTSSLVVAWAIARHRLFDIEPLARDKVIEWMSDGIILVDDRGNVRSLNPAAQRILGVASSRGVRGTPCHRLFAHVPALASLCRSPEDRQAEVVMEGTDPRYYEVFISSLADAAGNTSGKVITLHDSTKRRVAERSLRVSEERYRTLTEAAQDLIFIVDTEGTIIFANSFAARQWGCLPAELTGQPLSALLPWDSKGTQSEVIREVASSGNPAYLEHKVRLADRDAWLHTSLVALHTDGGTPDSVLGISREVTELVRMREDLRALSLIDDLTGLCNRRGFLTLARQQLKLAQRNDEHATILIADLDGLKEINDTYGHEEGDRALAEVAGIIRMKCRESDVVARWGGDEFAVLAIEATPVGADSLVQRILDAVERRNSASPRSYGLSISIGLARDRAVAVSSIEDILSAADRRMYEDKKAKRARSQSVVPE